MWLLATRYWPQLTCFWVIGKEEIGLDLSMPQPSSRPPESNISPAVSTDPEKTSLADLRFFLLTILFSNGLFLI